eukprot:6456942-Amphidinium_carterae.3
MTHLSSSKIGIQQDLNHCQMFKSQEIQLEKVEAFFCMIRRFGDLPSFSCRKLSGFKVHTLWTSGVAVKRVASATTAGS